MNKPYWKILALLFVTGLIGFVISALTKYSHFTKYNLIDFYVITSCIYEILFTIGFAWNIRIFNKLFWKVTAIPYMLLMYMTPFFISNTFNQDYHYKEIILGNPVSMIFAAILSIVSVYIVYKYAYKDEI